MKKTQAEFIAIQLEKLEVLRSNRVHNLTVETVIRSTSCLFLFAALGAVVIEEPMWAWLFASLCALCFVWPLQLGRIGSPEQYRDIFSASTRLAFALESQNPEQMREITRDSLEMLERAAAAAANPQSVHFHSRLAIAALGTLKIVGDERTLQVIGDLVARQGNSEEQQCVLDRLIDCINGINRRIYGDTDIASLLRPAAMGDAPADALVRPAANPSILLPETLLRPTVGSTAGPD